MIEKQVSTDATMIPPITAPIRIAKWLPLLGAALPQRHRERTDATPPADFPFTERA
jgi:hypothetical protein